MRAFIAFELPEDLRQEIGNLLTPFRSVKGFRIPQTCNLHLTLTFLNEITEEESILINRILQGTGPAAWTGKVQFTETGCFPSRKRPRVFWIGMRELTGKISLLKNSIDLRLKENPGKEIESREFRPHLTLARLSFWSDIQNSVLTKMEDSIQLFLSQEKVFTDFKPQLFQSILEHGKHPVYKRLTD